MAFKVLVGILIIAVVAISAENICRENEYWNDCGSPCQPKCGQEEPVACTRNCKPGCFCKTGLIKSSIGCVPKYMCKQLLKAEVCGQNEEFSNCANDCEPSCENPFGPWKCSDECRSECTCKKGFFRNADGECVELNRCPIALNVEKVCGQNEEFSNCANDCEPSCGNPFGPWTCTDDCRSECTCKKGFFRNADKQCVELSRCPKALNVELKEEVCGQNEEFSNCANDCEPSCGNPFGPWKCSDECRSECTCRKGFFRNADGQCVELSRCPIALDIELKVEMCGQNEEFSNCANDCEPSCNNPFGPWKCSDECRSECTCKKGFFRNADGQCVEISRCPKALNVEGKEEKCGQNEEFSNCANDCEPSCNNPFGPWTCTDDCRSECTCKKGFFRNADKQCVEISRCPKALNVEYEVCGQNEEFSNCANDCEPSCDNPFGPWTCTDDCRSECSCKKGFFRNTDGRCVKLNRCSAAFNL